MKVSRKSAFMMSLCLGLFGMGSAAQAETVCQDLWAVKAMRANKGLVLVLTEKNEQGPACDLVLEAFNYDEADASISLKIRPDSYCPIEAIAHRKTQTFWTLPFGLRQGGELRLIVNGRESGILKMDQFSVSHEGGCQ